MHASLEHTILAESLSMKCIQFWDEMRTAFLTGVGDLYLFVVLDTSQTHSKAPYDTTDTRKLMRLGIM